MYEEKQLRLWLMSIPFWVLNFFGAHMIFSKYELFNDVRESLVVESGYLYGIEGLTVEELIKFAEDEKNSPRNNLIELSERYKNFTRDVKINIKNSRLKVAEKVMICDSKPNKTENRFTGYLCALGGDKTYRSSVYV